MARTPGRAQHLASQGVSLVEGDLDDNAALQQLVSGAAAVIHAAGAVRGSSQQDFDHINVTGTAHLLAAITAQAEPPRLLLLSSLAAREPGLSWYAASKRAGEALLGSHPDLDWLVLRPPAVYGPGDREMLPVFEAMARGIAPVPGDPAGPDLPDPCTRPGHGRNRLPAQRSGPAPDPDPVRRQAKWL